MAPLIGLNVDINVDKPTEARIARAYYEAILAVGCIPVLIPPMERKPLRALLRRLDGVVLIGGRDYNPELYGQTVHDGQSFSPLHPDRQAFDLMLAREALRIKKLPVLGICGGAQALVIALGGTLYVHIPAAFPSSKILHRGDGKSTRHSVSLIKDTRLAKIYGTLFLASTVSSHHQSARDLGEVLILSAIADDGVIEGFELPSHEFVIGVQWHPERDLATSMPLFEAFARSARKRARNRSKQT
jgi:putative glutamine amidotransferase